VRKTNARAITCCNACGFQVVGEGNKIHPSGKAIPFLEMQLSLPHARDGSAAPSGVESGGSGDPPRAK